MQADMAKPPAGAILLPWPVTKRLSSFTSKWYQGSCTRIDYLLVLIVILLVLVVISSFKLFGFRNFWRKSAKRHFQRYLILYCKKQPSLLSPHIWHERAPADWEQHVPVQHLAARCYGVGPLTSLRLCCLLHLYFSSTWTWRNMALLLLHGDRFTTVMTDGM